VVKDIQEYLKLACPQSIYRWYKGQILPSVDNLLMLSRLLGVHMEDLLAVGTDGKDWEPEENSDRIMHCELRVWKEWEPDWKGIFFFFLKRLAAYWRRLYDV